MELADAFVAELGASNFRIVFQHPVSQSRVEMGWQDKYDQNYVIRYWASEQSRQQTSRWINDADVVIQGRFPTRFLRSRIRAGKLTFAYQERYWKRKFSYWRVLLRLPRLIRDYWSVNYDNYHLLAAGAYTAHDLNRIGLFTNRSWKFGYFINPHPAPPLRPPEATSLSILWCARICAIKQPERVLEIATGLKQRQIDFHITMVGDGELKSDIKDAIEQRGLAECITLTGWKSAQQVKQMMLNADVFLMTSHQREGWGVVVNEAISCGCMVVVNRQIGSAPWLIKHGETGFLYDDNELETVLNEITSKTRQQLLAMGSAGYRHITKTWSCQASARRFIALATALNQGNRSHAETLFDHGPCSKA